MTREELILSATREYNSGVTLSSPSNIIHFEAGAKWADEHPINVWHDGTPCEQYDPERYLYYDRCNNLIPEIYNFRKHGNYRWAYINDPLPKGDEK